MGEVQLIIEESTFGKFPRVREPRTERETGFKQQIGDDDAAVSVKFGNVFTGKRSGAPEHQRQSLVDHLVIRSPKTAEYRLSGQ